MSTRTYTQDSLRLEIIEECADGSDPNEQTARFFKAQLWPLTAGWDYVVDDISYPPEAWKESPQDSEIVRLIELALEGKKTEWGDDPALAIGRLIVKVAQRRADDAYEDLLRDCRPGDPEYGSDVRDPIAVDRSAA